MRVIRFHGRGGQVQRLRAALWEPPHSWKGSRRRTRLSVEDYLKLQGRFCHLFEPTRQDEVIRHIQERVDAHWNQFNA
ncbi:MAG: hypothetical protein ACXW37_09730 [Nitrospira sp.]